MERSIQIRQKYYNSNTGKHNFEQKEAKLIKVMSEITTSVVLSRKWRRLAKRWMLMGVSHMFKNDNSVHRYQFFQRCQRSLTEPDRRHPLARKQEHFLRTYHGILLKLTSATRQEPVISGRSARENRDTVTATSKHIASNHNLPKCTRSLYRHRSLPRRRTSIMDRSPPDKVRQNREGNLWKF